MKKLLLLSALALCSGAAMADTDLYDLFTPKEGVSEGAYTITKAWDCDYEYDSWKTPVDLTSYSKLVANLTATQDVKVKIMVQFAQEGDNITDAGDMFELKAGTAKDVYVDLVNTVADGVKVNQIYLQADGGGATITVNSYKFISKSTDPVTEKELTMSVDGNGKFNFLPAEQFDKLADDVEVDFTIAYDGSATDASGATVESVSGWGVGGYSYAGNYDGMTTIYGKAGGTFTITITVADLKTTAKNGGSDYVSAEWGGQGITFNMYNGCSITKAVALVKDAAPEALKPALENAELVGTEYFSLTGVKSATPLKGINIIRRSFSNGSVQLEKALVK